MKALIVGVLLGGSLLVFGIGLRRPVLGICIAIIELGTSLLSSSVAAFLYFPFLIILLSLSPKDEIPLKTNKENEDVFIIKENEDVFIITAKRGPLMGNSYRLSNRKQVLTFGRENCDVAFPANTAGVGRKHCELLLQDGRPLLHDLHSSYGTFLLNPTRQLVSGAAVTLEDRSMFCLASTENVFQITYYHD